MRKRPNPLRPERIRTIEKPFAWIPFRALRDRHLANLSDQAKLLYFFLCIVSDRQGLSFYKDQRINESFQLKPNDIRMAKDELRSKDLIAFDGYVYQVLSLPEKSKPKYTIQTERRTGKPELLGNILERLCLHQDK